MDVLSTICYQIPEIARVYTAAVLFVGMCYTHNVLAQTDDDSQSTAKKEITEISEDIWHTVFEAIECVDRPFGYTVEEMSIYPGEKHRLSYVNDLFREVREVPRQTNLLAGEILNSASWAEGLDPAFSLLLEKQGLVIHNSECCTTELLRSQSRPVDAVSLAHWNSLPADIRDLVDRIVITAQRSRVHLERAFDWDAMASVIYENVEGDLGTLITDLGSDAVFDYAAAPWIRYGEPCEPSFNALESTNMTELVIAGTVFTHDIEEIVTALRNSIDALPLDERPEFDICRLETQVGTLCILGFGDNKHDGKANPDAIVIDLGGDDMYTGRLAVPRSYTAPVGVLIDMSGDDIYEADEAHGSIACGLFGIGALIDCQGNDRYIGKNSGLGCAWHGVGLLVDMAGNDLYEGRHWTQGVAHAGLGALIDLSGDDRYTCQLESQGVGSTLGVGLLLDHAGNDVYHAVDNEDGRSIDNPSAQTVAHESSMCQGAGYGRRADTADRKSLAGGVGALIDGSGDDSYYGGVFSQGVGYWWSLGMLVDFAGDDTYRGVYYAQGASAHFAIASFLDIAGNDIYNTPEVMSQVLGNGRDGSIATFYDIKGDDQYHIPDRAGGEGDINGIGLFCDFFGDDMYNLSHSAHMGAATGTYRPKIPTIGVFLDLEGLDIYLKGDKPANDTSWYYQSGPSLWGFGYDCQNNK